MAADVLRAYAAAIRPGVESSGGVEAGGTQEAVVTLTPGEHRHALVHAPSSERVASLLAGAIVRVEPDGTAVPVQPMQLPAVSVTLTDSDTDAVAPVSVSIGPRGRMASVTDASGPIWLQSARARQPRGWLPPLRLSGPNLRCMVGNTLDDAHAIFAVVNGSHSVRIDASGECQSDAPWPRAISGQVRWGEAGAIAWHNAGTTCVMWRERPDGEVGAETAPFTGALAFPQPDGSIWWTSRSGLWTWAPGEPWSKLVETPPLLGLQVDAGGVRLDARGDGEGFAVRSRISHAFRWVPGSNAAEPLTLGVEGPCWSVSSARSVTALAFPHSDHVLLRHRDGAEHVLTCPYPFNVAWAGPSLVVSTGGAELLMFVDILTWLEHDVATGDRQVR